MSFVLYTQKYTPSSPLGSQKVSLIPKKKPYHLKKKIYNFVSGRCEQIGHPRVNVTKSNSQGIENLKIKRKRGKQCRSRRGCCRGVYPVVKCALREHGGSAGNPRQSQVRIANWQLKGRTKSLGEVLCTQGVVRDADDRVLINRGLEALRVQTQAQSQRPAKGRHRRGAYAT